MNYFRFEIPKVDGKAVSYSPGWHGTMPKCPKNVTVLLYNDKEFYGIAQTDDDAVLTHAELRVIPKEEADKIMAEAKDEEGVYFGDKMAHRWDKPKEPESIEPDPYVNHKGQNCIFDDKRLCQEGYCADCWLARERIATPAAYEGTLAYWCSDCGKAYTVDYRLPLGLKAANINMGITCPVGHKGTISIKSVESKEAVL